MGEERELLQARAPLRVLKISGLYGRVRTEASKS
jgi:hypothetical protein